MKRMLYTCALAVSGALASAVSAAPLSMSGTFDGFKYGSISMNVRAQGIGGDWHRENLATGMLKWSQGNGGNFNSFCTELTQTINQGEFVTYDTTQLNVAPKPADSRFPHLDGGMGLFRAGLIQDLANKHYASITDNVTAAAFQISVWALVYETDGSQIVSDGDGSPNNAYHGIDVLSGSFTLAELGVPGSLRSQVANLANTWLAGLNSVTLSSLLALSNPDRQDQVIVIPLPAPVLMAGLGLLAIPLMRRRLFRA